MMSLDTNCPAACLVLEFEAAGLAAGLFIGRGIADSDSPAGLGKNDLTLLI